MSIRKKDINTYRLQSELLDDAWIELVTQDQLHRRGPRAVLSLRGRAIECEDLHELIEVKRLIDNAVRVGRRLAGSLWKHRRERLIRLRQELAVPEITLSDRFITRVRGEEEEEF